VILAAGLTPAWQQILMFERLRPGAVNRAESAMWCGSGKVLNVGAALHQMKADCLTLSPIGGATGAQIEADFAKRGIPARWIRTAAPSRVCTTLLDRQAGATTELVENSSPLTADEIESYLTAYSEEVQRAEIVVLSGSLPVGTPSNFYRRLMELSAARTIMDVRGRELLECLPLKPWLVKPNREELAATVGRPLETDFHVIEAMSELRERGAEWAIVSAGGGPLLVLGPQGLTRFDPPVVKVINPIGCGDSLTAAIAMQTARGASPVDAIRFAVDYAARKAAVLSPVLDPD
jgi:1-phosphofructokinase family hexose kinase